MDSEPNLGDSIFTGALVGFLLGLTGCCVIFTGPLIGTIIGAIFGLSRYLVHKDERKNRR